MFSVLFALASAHAATYQIDAAHTRVGFGITHMMVSTVRGEFGTVTGTVEYDPANVGATRASAEVTVTSVDTRDAKRDDHLRSPDFFDIAKFPTMTFSTTAVKNAGAAGFDLVGPLTIHGVTKEVSFHVDPISKEYKDPWGNIKAGTHATAKINRKDFGLTWNTALDGGGYIVGDEVSIELDVEMARK
ncbi:polyisoprenoid-binding protein [Deltaproteobacteria bacterium]|nr:polyisoprenoid-binding protein [Deltaproteobacteria bacterium]